MSCLGATSKTLLNDENNLSYPAKYIYIENRKYWVPTFHSPFSLGHETRTPTAINGGVGGWGGVPEKVGQLPKLVNVLGLGHSTDIKVVTNFTIMVLLMGKSCFI